MVKLGTKVWIFDNSGARLVQCFNLGKKKTHRTSVASTGEIIKARIVKYRPLKKVKKKDKVTVMLVSSTKKVKYLDSRFKKYKQTRGVLVKKNRKGDFEPIANRIKTPIDGRFKKKKNETQAALKLRSSSKGIIF